LSSKIYWDEQPEAATENELPQLHVEAALGFLITKRDPSSPS
jgi:hypothetical protein